MKGISQKARAYILGLQWDKTKLRDLSHNIICCLSSFFAGVCATLLFADLIDLKILLALVILFALFNYRTALALPVFFLLLGLSWASLLFSIHLHESLPIEHEGQTIQLRGSLIGIPDINNTRTKFDFRISHALSAANLPIAELQHKKVILNCYRCLLDFEPAQHWQLSVRLKRPHGYASWGAFDYEKYLFRHKIIATGYIRTKEDNISLSVNALGAMDLINRWRWQIRNFVQHNSAGFPIGRAILYALMIGDKSELEQEHKLVFQKTGISHLMAISGLHIGLAFLASISFLKLCFAPVAQIYNWIPRQRLVLIPALMVAFLYAALAGFAISTQRAMIMLAVYVLVRLLRRDVSLFKVLLIAAAIISIYDPFSILDIGFWLSCLAVVVIALMGKSHSIERDEKTNNQNLGLIKLQPALWLGMLPATLLFFGKVSLISPLVNLVLVPLFCVVLIPLTLSALLLKMVGLGSLSSSLVILLTQVYERGYQGLAWLAEFPFAQWAMPPMTLIDWLLFVLVALACYFFQTHRRVLVVSYMLWFFWPSDGSKLDSAEYNLTLLDVGQGLAIVVETSGSVLVYDTGPRYPSGFNTAEAVLIPYLHYRGIKQIDTLIISHADNDHMGSFSALAKSFPIKAIMTSRVDQIPQAQRCLSGLRWSTNAVDFTILSPDAGSPTGSNNHSCVLKISNGQIDTLISGDIEKPVERYLLNHKANIAADILLVPHHGSKTSSTQAFIDAVAPQIALLAAGYRNRYGHPHASVVSRYSQSAIDLYSTIDSGSISLNIKNNKIGLSLYRVVKKGFWQRVKKPT